MGKIFRPTRDRTYAESWLLRYQSAANKTQLETVWGHLKSNSTRRMLLAEVWTEADGKASTIPRTVTTYSFPDKTGLVSEGQHRSRYRGGLTDRVRGTGMPGWISLADEYWVFDRGMPENHSEAIRGLLGPSTLVRKEYWQALALWWLKEHCIRRGAAFPQSPKLTPAQRASLMDGATTHGEHSKILNAPY